MLPFLLLFLLAAEEPDRAKDQTPAVVRQQVDVVGVTPIDGVGIPRDRYPANVQRISVSSRENVSDAIGERAASVQQSESVGNRWQRDLLFRGFLASPLLGAPEGLAVFRDGVRMNEPFGDTVNWDTLPDGAIRSIEVIPGSIGAFGLNALGGVVSLTTRDGFADRGSAVSLSGGSFGSRRGELAAGWNRDDVGYFTALTHDDEEGWRHHSPSDRSALFGSLIWSGARTSADLRVTAARSRLTGNGAAPIQLVAEDRRQVFTHPDETRNRLAGVSSALSHQTPLGLLEANVHWRRTSSAGANGDDTPYDECTEDETLLCLGGEIVFDASGGLVRVAPGSDFDAVVNRNRTRQGAYGVGLQISRPLAQRHRLIGGATVDGGHARFRSSTELAGLAPSREVRGAGITTLDSLVAVDTRLLTTSLYLAGVFDLTSAAGVTASVRANRSRLTLDDRLGVALDGDHRFTSVNPSAGVTFATPAAVLFGGVSQSSRTPTPVELTCADEEAPCRLPNAFVSDPPLDQVVARTIEIGARSAWREQSWSVAVFRTMNRDDIIFVSSGRQRGEGHFTNVGSTRREGFELVAGGAVAARLNWYGSYSRIDATFRNAFRIASPHHPLGDGSIAVEPGDRITQIPRHTSKVGLTLNATDRISVGAHLRASSSSFHRGDEGNLAPPLPGYTVMDLTSRVAVRSGVGVEISLRNATNARYATFGTFGEADDVLGDEYDDARFVTPAPPRHVRISLTWRR